MTRRALASTLAAALALAAPAWADDGMEGAQANRASALARQALALLEQGGDHQAAEAKLDAALAAGEKGGVDLRALRAAHEALHREAAAEAERLLQEAFPGGDKHVVGVTYRPGSQTALLISGIAGSVLLGAAALGLVRRRVADERYGSEPRA